MILNSNFKTAVMTSYIKAAVTASLCQYSQAYSQKDVKMLLAITDPDYLGFGSGPDEQVTSRSELQRHLERDFAQSDELSMHFGPISIAYAGDVAWCAGECVIEAEAGGTRQRLTGRMTAVLRKRGDEWLFAHTHFSLPDRGQENGKSFPEKK